MQQGEARENYFGNPLNHTGGLLWDIMTDRSPHQASLQDIDFEALAAFSRYRRYPGFSAADVGTIARADAARALGDNGTAWLVKNSNGNQVSCAYLHAMDWDSNHFCMPMYRLEVLSSATATLDECTALITSLTASAALHKGAHLSVDVDIDDYNSLNALLFHGFEVLDLKRTYCTNRMRHDIDFVRMRSRVRPYQPHDYEQVMQMVRTTTFPSRFTRDRFIHPELTTAMYEKWFSLLLSAQGKTANAVVYERRGEVIGCGAIGEKCFSYAGLPHRLRTGSLYAGRPDAVGAYTPVLYQLIMDALESHGLVDTSASLNNVTVCRVLEGFRSYKSAATCYSLRKVVS